MNKQLVTNRMQKSNMKKGRLSDWLPADQRSAQESILFNNFISDLGMDIRKVIMKFAKNTVLETSSSSG